MNQSSSSKIDSKNFIDQESLDEDVQNDLNERRARPIKPLGTTRRLNRSKTPTPTNPNPNQRRNRFSSQETLQQNISNSGVRASTSSERRPWFPFPNNNTNNLRSTIEQQIEFSEATIKDLYNLHRKLQNSSTGSTSSSNKLADSDLSSFYKANRRAISVEPEDLSSSLSRGIHYRTIFGRKMSSNLQEFERLNRGDVVLPPKMEEKEEYISPSSTNKKKSSSSSSDSSSSSSTTSIEKDQKKEKVHFQNVLKAFDQYLQFSLASNNARRRSFYALPKSHRLLCASLGSQLPGPILSNDPKEIVSGGRGFKARLDEIDDRIRRNAEFLDQIVSDSKGFLGDEEELSGEKEEDDENVENKGKKRSSSENNKKDREDRIENHEIDKVRSTLKQFVRDWSEEGKLERLSAYEPILEALEEEFSFNQRERLRILVPGAGLGRLAFEIAKRGFTCQGNEFSFYMLLSSHFILNKTQKVLENIIYPFIHSSSNWRKANDMLRPIQIPDIDPNSLSQFSKSDFSMVAGEFVEVYSKLQEKSVWNSIVTCFFIDTAHNFVRYLEVINHCLPLGGIWINVGPLLWHFEGSMAMNEQEISIELTLEEVFDLIVLMGFKIEKQKTLPKQPYTGNQYSMLTYEYSPEFWIARKEREIVPANSDI